MVVLPKTRLHDVNDGLAAIHNDPLAVGLSLDAWLGETGFTHGVAHAGCQRLGLAVGRAGGNDDPLKQRRQMLGVKDLNVLGLDVFQPVHNGTLEFLNVFFGNGLGSHQ